MPKQTNTWALCFIGLPTNAQSNIVGKAPSTNWISQVQAVCLGNGSAIHGGRFSMPTMSKYYQNKAAGICVRCESNPNDGETLFCLACREKVKTYSKLTRQKAKQVGLCVHCGKNKAEPEQSTCKQCQRAWQDYYYGSANKKEKERTKQRREQRKIQGLCISCGQARDTHRLKCNKCHKASLIFENKARAKRKSRGLCTECGKMPVQNNYVVCESCHQLQTARNKTNRVARNEQSKDWRKRLWQNILTAYGDKCICCGETEPMFLEIDHIQNNGSEQRKSIRGGASFHRWLQKNNYPQNDYQLLCRNCNYGKFRNGGICPHKARGA